MDYELGVVDYHSSEKNINVYQESAKTYIWELCISVAVVV